MEQNFEENSFFSDNNDSFIHMDKIIKNMQKEDNEYLAKKNKFL